MSIKHQLYMSLITFVNIIPVRWSLTFMAQFMYSNFIVLCYCCYCYLLFIYLVFGHDICEGMHAKVHRLRLKANLMEQILSCPYVNSEEWNGVTWLSWKALLVTELSHWPNVLYLKQYFYSLYSSDFYSFFYPRHLSLDWHPVSI